MSATTTQVFKESAEVAREIGVSVESLRHWEKIGKITPPLRTTGGRRLWTEGDISAIRAMRGERKGGVAVEAA